MNISVKFIGANTIRAIGWSTALVGLLLVLSSFTFLSPISNFRLYVDPVNIVFKIFGPPSAPDFLKTSISSSDLEIRVLTAYNFIVDSNVESPSTYAPNSAHIGAKICNTGIDTIKNVFANIGDNSALTPGVYPYRTHTGLAGSFSLTHVGGSAGTSEATRYMPLILPGECINQFWLVTYPNLDDNGNSVTQGIKPDDDLWLNYDVWANGEIDGNPVNDVVNKTVFMRNEISAAANKIWPNTASKVPPEYLQLLEDSLGWRVETSSGGPAKPGEVFTLEGIWYDIGNVRQGFDNNGDYLPDYNAWMQPVGDASIYNADCFRLVGAVGLLIIKRGGQPELLIPFQDQLYFENIPDDNTGVVGLVYYSYAALDGPCTANLTPYQEVASGFDNEKFNGDYGIDLDLAISEENKVTFSKSLDIHEIKQLPETLEFTLDFANEGTADAGYPDLGTGLVISDIIIEGTTYIAGSANSGNTVPAGVSGYTILYSTDDGLTWTSAEPPASNVTNIRWLLNDPLPPGSSGNVTFQIQVPALWFYDPFICNSAQISFGFSSPFASDVECSFLPGVNKIGDQVWEDDGGTTGTQANGKREGDEAPIANIPVSLYLDINNNGELEDSDLYWRTDTTDSFGLYLFDSLPDANYIVIVHDTIVTDQTKYDGWGATTQKQYAVPLDTAYASIDPDTFYVADFGFSPVLVVEKSVVSSTPVLQGNEVTFNLSVTNLMASEGEGVIQTGLSKLFFVDEGGTFGKVKKADFDGSNLEDIFAITLISMDGLAIDVTNEHIYYTQAISGGGIRRTDLNGSNPTILVSGQESPRRVELDVENGKMYWTTDTELKRANLDGTGIEVIHTTSNKFYSLALDPDGGWIYFGIQMTGSSTIQRISWDLTAVQILYTDSNSDRPTDIELDLVNNKMYWVQECYSSLCTHIIRANLNGTSVDTIVRSPNVKIPKGLALNVPQGRIYWSEPGAFGTGGQSPAIRTTRLDGSDFQEILTMSGEDPRDLEIPVGSAVSEFNVNTTLDPVPLKDSFHPDSLEFVSANILPDNIDAVNGIITWNNIGPINASESKSISVIFKVLDQATTSPSSVKNTDWVNNAYFANGDPANADTASVTVPVDPAGTISGYVWSDGDADGWQGTLGYETGESFVDNAKITLHSCTSVAANGTCNGTERTYSTYTDENGYYLFEGLEPGLHFKIVLDETTLPGTIDQTGDPDDDPNRGSGNGGLCGTGGGNAACDAQWDNDKDWFEMGVDVYGGESWDIEDINFGYQLNPTIFGMVWEDVNGDGNEDIGEDGIGSVTVELQNGSCTPGVNCPTTVTDGTGNYQFEDLTAGTNYIITVLESTLPSTGTWTETYESDASINNSISKTLSSGEISGSHEFAFNQAGTASVGDTIFYDFNGNGIEETNEEGIQNVLIFLYKDNNSNGDYDPYIDAFIDTTRTSAAGYYLFDQLPQGDYIVIIDEADPNFPDNVFLTADPSEPGVVCYDCDGKSEVALTSLFVDTIDFGYKPYGTGFIGDLVWIDSDGNGVQLGPSEVGIENISVELWVDLNGDATFALYDVDTTDSNGNYLFENLPDANYEIRVLDTDPDMPQDAYGNSYSPTTPIIYSAEIDGGSLVTLDSNPCIGCELDVDFGFVRLGSIGDMVFWDANADGELDYNEEGIENITVYLLDEFDTLIDSTITSDGSGSITVGWYNFNGLPPAEYTILIDYDDPDLSGATLLADPSADGVPCTDPSAFECDHQYTTTLNYGTTFVGADFGYLPSGVIGDFAWFDQNGDGIQDLSEPGIANLQVVLTNKTTVVINGNTYSPDEYTDTVYTDINGEYIYSQMPDGTYEIDIEIPATKTITSGPESVGVTTINVVVTGGEITDIGGSTCVDCGLDVDFGFELNGSYNLSGTICIDGAALDGVCGDVDDSAIDYVEVYLYNDNSEYLGSALTDSNGDYSFTNLIADTYIVSMGTALPPLDIAVLTTTVDDTPASDLTVYENSVTQTVTVAGDVQGMDFAFDYEVDLDFGDLPQAYMSYSVHNGPRHIIPLSNSLYLGNSVDTEADAIASPMADGDGADEDGITFSDRSTWTHGLVSDGNGGSLTVDISGTGHLLGWMDFELDLSLANNLIIDTTLTAGQHTLQFNIPSGTDLLYDSLYSRFRVFETSPPFPGYAYSGTSTNGEVEDYLLSAAPCALTITQIIVGNCDPSTNKTEVQVTVEWSDEPGAENIIVSIGDSTRTIDVIGGAPSPQTVIFNLESNGACENLVTANFQTTTDCGDESIFALPQPCNIIVTAPNPCPGGPDIVGGRVFRDYNENGIWDQEEVTGVENITVTAYDDNGNVYGPVNTDGNGDYYMNIPDGLPVRIEFTNIPVLFVQTSTFNGPDSRTTVQFVTGPVCEVNLGVSIPSTTCN